MSGIDYIVILVYLVGVVLVGLKYKEKTKSSADYMVADRKLGISIFMGTYLATAIGGGVLQAILEYTGVLRA